MPTPDFEDWLERQDLDISYSTTAEKWRQYVIDEFGFRGGSLDVAEQVRQVKYGVFGPLNIRAVTFERIYAGETYTQTRYVIPDRPGLWGAISAYRIAEESWTRARQEDLAEMARLRREILEKLPPRQRRDFED